MTDLKWREEFYEPDVEWTATDHNREFSIAIIHGGLFCLQICDNPFTHAVYTANFVTLDDAKAAAEGFRVNEKS